MTEADDIQLLREFAERRSDAAFAALVTRYVNLVYSVALRQAGNPHAAEEITQAVFIILARKAGSLGLKTVLSGWLYQTARLTAANYLRTERRRVFREQEVYMQSLSNEPEPDVWAQIAPLLDDALSKLGEKDQHAILLRFFENKSLAEVGATLGASEDAAKMRVNRALEKLRRFFTKRGVTLTTTLIAGAVSANSVQAAPAGLAVSAVAAAKGSAVTASTLTLVKGALKLMAWTKAKVAIMVGACVLLMAGTTATFVGISVSTPPPEPTYQGRPLRQWISADPPLRLFSYEDTVAYRRTALLAMGQPAVRYLHWMIVHPRQFLDGHIGAVDRFKSHLPLRLQQMLPASHRKRANFMNVVCAVELIGPNAAAVAPDLAWLWESNGNPEYSTYNGFPMALADLGDASPDIIAALHRHFTSPDKMHGALSAFAAWRLNPGDAEAASRVRYSLTPVKGGEYASYADVVLGCLEKIGSAAAPFFPEIHRLIDMSATASSDQQAVAGLAAWRLFHTPDQAVEVIKRLGVVAAGNRATPNDVNEFASAALKLKEIPVAREAAIPILKELKRFPDESAARFCSDVLDRLETAESR